MSKIKERGTLPETQCDIRLTDALEVKRKELCVEICAEIDTQDALQFVLWDALGLGGEAGWIANDEMENTDE